MSKPKNDPSHRSWYVLTRVTFEAYERLRNDRFFKYDEEQVNYRESEGPERCGGCVHFFKRVLDGFGVGLKVELPRLFELASDLAEVGDVALNLEAFWIGSAP